MNISGGYRGVAIVSAGTLSERVHALNTVHRKFSRHEKDEKGEFHDFNFMKT